MIYAYVHLCPMMSYILPREVVHLSEVGDLVNANPSECSLLMDELVPSQM